MSEQFKEPEVDVSIKKISDRDYWVGKNHLRLRDDNIVHTIATGPANEEMAITLAQVYNDFIEMNEQKIDVIIEMDGAGYPSVKARKVFKKMMERPDVDKFAFVGLKPVAKVLMNFMLGIIRKKDFKFFYSVDDALEWVKSGR